MTIPNTVPPPKGGALAQASRTKDGFFVNQKKKDYRKYLEGAAATPASDHTPHEDSSDGENQPNSKEFVPKEGNLKRVQVIKLGHNPPVRYLKNRGGGGGSSLNPNGNGTGGNSEKLQGAANFHSNLRRSFRYRKISLRTEFERPLFETTREESESEDEGDTNSMYQTQQQGGRGPSSVPGPQMGGGGGGGESPLRAQQQANDSSPSSENVAAEDENEEFRKIIVVPRHANSNSQQQPNTLSTISLASHSPGNAYSKVTVMGARRSSTSSGKRPAVPLRSNSQSDIFSRKNSASSSHDGSNHLPSPILSPIPCTSHELEESWTILPPPLFDALDLPPLGITADGRSMYGSQNSLDNILVDPPEMFVSSGGFEISSEAPHKRKLSRTRKVGSPVDLPVSGNGVVGNGGSSSSSSSSNGGFGTKNSRSKIEPIPGFGTGKGLEENLVSKNHHHHHHHHHHQQQQPPPPADRDSTESSDTGYTSSTTTSPGYISNEHSKEQKAFHHQNTDNLVYPEEDEEEEGEEEEVEEGSREVPATPKLIQYPSRGGFLDSTASFGGGGGIVGPGTLRKVPSVGSLASITSENSRCYVPLVFHSGRVEDTGVNPDPNLFSVQVCLVENSDELIKVGMDL